jgi:flagellar hook-associated protein 2
VINPLISSSNGTDNAGAHSYKNAASLIAQGLAYANKQSGVSGWLTEDVGSGLTLTIQGSNGIEVSDVALSVTDEILGTALSLNKTNVSAAHTNAQYTITDTSGTTQTYDAVNDGTSITIGGTSFSVTTSALGTATVKVSGDHSSITETPSSTSTTAGSAITTQSANTASIYELDGGINKYTTAQDAHLTIDGVNIVRSTNSISDFVTGLTFQIMANPAPGQTKSAKVNVTLGPDNAEAKVTDLMTAYNKLIKDYNAMTANANNGRASDGKAGTFGNAPTTLSFVENIKRRFATGATYNIGTNDANGNPYILSLASLGLDYQLDGTLKYNSVEYLTSQANGLREKFLKGLRIGYVSPTDNLMTFVKAQSAAAGALAQEMTAESNSIDALTKEQDTLQTRLNKIQDNYIAQYSGLNALLFQLNATSTNLGSALSALTNMAAGK